MLAHIAGIPVEETVLSVAPVALATVGLASLRLRRLVTTKRRPWPRHAGRRAAPGRRA